MLRAVLDWLEAQKKMDLKSLLAEHAPSEEGQLIWQNAICSPMTRYSPHYLMFGQRPRLPVDLYFPTFRNVEAPMREASTKHVDKFVATVHD